MVYWLVLVAVQAALFVLAELLRPKPELEDAKPAGIGDFQFPTATEDRVVPLIWGTCKLKGPNVVWYGDFRQEAITERVKTGLFSHETLVKGFKYFLGVQFALSRMAADALLRVWIGDVEVYSAHGVTSAAVAAAGSGYQAGDVLTISGGTFTTPAQVRVSALSILGTNLVLGVTLVRRGVYTSFPSSTAATTGGHGTGCTVALTFGSEVTHGGTLTISCPELFGGDDLGQGGVVGTLQFFSGTDTQVASPYLAAFAIGSATPTGGAGGTGYVVGNVLTISGGTFTRAAIVKVTAVSSGAVTAVSVLDGGFYSVFPTSPASTSGSGFGFGGSGCTLVLTPRDGFQSVGGVTPRYLRSTYLIPATDPIYLGNSTSIKPWAFEERRVPNYLGLSGSGLVNGVDCNPMNVIYELLTNKEWGLRQATGSIDATNFSAAGTTLASEGNGFSFLLDRPMQAAQLLRLVEEQVDGVVFFNQLAGKWQVNLARGGYDPNSLVLISASNIVEMESFARGAWKDTVNQVAAKFVDRDDGYKETSALAQDTASVRVLQGQVVPTEIDYPGVKNRTLANSLAWRDLRGLSYPLAKAVIIVNRTLYDVQPGQVIAWTYEIGGESFVRLPMRVGDVDYGELADGRIRLSLIQDVFTSGAGSFSDPAPTSWQPPGDALAPFAFETAFEAPRAIVRRDPLTGGEILDKVYAAARRVGPEVGFKIAERHASGTPSGAFAEVGTVYKLMLVGSLSATLSPGSAVPLTTLTLAPGPDLRDAMEAAFTDSTDASDVGTNLVNLILVGTEFMLVSSAQVSGSNVQLNGVYRGVLDSVQGTWGSGTPVYLLFVGAGLSDSPVPATLNVDVKLLPFSASAQLPEASAFATSFAMANRVRRPYPPSRPSLAGTAWPTTASLEQIGSGPETYGLDLTIRRRDYRTVDEAQALTADAPTFFPDFPTANTTTHKVGVRNDPAGANTLLFTSVAFSGTQQTQRRIEILKATNGVLPTTMRLETFATHLHDAVSRDSLYPLRNDFSTTSALTGKFNFGARAASSSSFTYTANAAGTHGFTLSSAFTAGNVEYSLNGAGFVTLISAGGTTGSITGVAVSDTIVIRHTSTDTAALKQIDMDAPGAGTDGYGIFFT